MPPIPRRALPPSGYKSPRHANYSTPPRGEFREPRDARNVYEPGDNGYHGRHKKHQHAWDTLHQNRDTLERLGGAGNALLLGVAGVGIGGGELQRAGAKWENRRLQRKLGERPKRQVKLAKGWDRKDPFMWHAEDGGNGAHDISTLGHSSSKNVRWGRTIYDASEQGGQLPEAVRRVNRKTLGALGVAMAVPVARNIGPHRENERLQRKLKAKQAAQRRKGTLVGKRDEQKLKRDREGAAMAASGGVLTGTGLIAGGVPGAKEPNGRRVWYIRGQNKQSRERVARGQQFPPEGADKDPRLTRSRLHPSNIGHNARQVAPLPRAGVLGFRANVHDDFIQDESAKTDGTAYQRGRRQGKIYNEHKIVGDMRRWRKASYPVTVGGAALTAAGVHRMKTSDKKEPTSKAAPQRDERNRGEKASAAALAGGTTMAGVGHVVPKLLGRQSRKWQHEAKRTTLAAQQLAPDLGGLETLPAKTGDFGEIRKPAKQTMYPEKTDDFVRQDRTGERIKGDAAYRARVGALRGRAAQARHFAEEFDDTARKIKAFRGPGLALAAVGASGLAGSSAARAGEDRRARKVTAAKAYVPRNPRPVLMSHWTHKPLKSDLAWDAGHSSRATRTNPVLPNPDAKKQVARESTRIGGLREDAIINQRAYDPTERFGRIHRRGTASGTFTKAYVGKAVTYGYMERRRNKVNTAQQLGGAALIAGGASHLQLGPQVARGQRMADDKGYGRQYRSATDQVRRGRNQTRKVSGQAVGVLRGRIPGFGTALDLIPAKLRPHAAIGAGALLAARGTPAHDERFVPTGRF